MTTHDAPGARPPARGYYPFFVDLKDRRVVVAGGGAIAEEKIERLLGTGARLTVVAPRATARIARWAAAGRLRWKRARYTPSDARGAFVVIAATGDRALSERIFRAREAEGRLVNAVDDAARCNFILPAAAGEGPLRLAISSSGASPALAQWVRDRIAREWLTPELQAFATLLGERRSEVRAALPTQSARERFWRGFVETVMNANHEAATPSADLEVRFRRALTVAVHAEAKAQRPHRAGEAAA